MNNPGAISEMQDKYIVKVLELGADIYENVEVSSRRALIESMELGKVIAIGVNNKKVYVNGRYIISFE